jgi:hypothetical protein
MKPASARERFRTTLTLSPAMPKLPQPLEVLCAVSNNAPASYVFSNNACLIVAAFAEGYL